MLLYSFFPTPIAMRLSKIQNKKALDFLQDIQEMLNIARKSVRTTQERAQSYAIQHRSPRILEVEKWVFLKTPKDSKTMRREKHYKLSSKYCHERRLSTMINAN